MNIFKNNKKIKFKNLKNQSGGLTIDFIFALTLVMGLAAILLSLSLTLTVASITQYITYSSARALMLGHHTRDDQVNNAQKQFLRLHTDPLFAPLFTGGWFELQNPVVLPNVGDLEKYSSTFPQIDVPSDKPNFFVGVTVTFIARMLDFEIPFFGSTSDFGGDGSGFNTNIASFLSKEPSSAQCRNFNVERWKAIRKLNVPGGVADYSSYTTEGGAIWWINDNGC
jgi:hypothetical protein